MFNLLVEIKDAIAILRLDKARTVAVGEKALATKFGIVILIFVPLFNLFLASLLFPSGFSAIFSRFLLWPMVVPILALVAAIFIIPLVVKKLFGVAIVYVKIFRVLAYAAIILLLSALPFLLALLNIVAADGLFNLLWFMGIFWIFVVAYSYLLNNVKLSKQEIVIVLVIAVLAYFLLQLILGRILVGPYYRILY